MFDFSLCAPLVRWVLELRLFTMPDDQSRCDGSVTAINAVVQDMSTGKPTLRCLVRHSNPESRWQAWVTPGKAHREQMLSALTGSGHPTRERSRSGSQLNLRHTFADRTSLQCRAERAGGARPCPLCGGSGKVPPPVRYRSRVVAARSTAQPGHSLRLALKIRGARAVVRRSRFAERPLTPTLSP
jgi:hypothetical protein